MAEDKLHMRIADENRSRWTSIRRGRVWLCWHSRESERKPYSSDLSDERWALIEPVITAWRAAHPSVNDVLAEKLIRAG